MVSSNKILSLPVGVSNSSVANNRIYLSEGPTSGKLTKQNSNKNYYYYYFILSDRW